MKIAVVSETRLAEGHLIEQSASYIFFLDWTWPQRATPDARVGFAIKSNLVNMLAARPKGINDRLITARLPLPRKKFASMISAYRIARASGAFGRLKEKVWERRGLSVNTKLKVYGAVVLPCLLYECET